MDEASRMRTGNRHVKRLAVFSCAAGMLFFETLIFHAARYIIDYPLAMTVIGGAVTGIGMGAFLAGRWPRLQSLPLSWVGAGTTLCMYLAAYVLLRCPLLPLLLPAVAAVFVPPSLLIAGVFATDDARRVYLFDMLGAASAVGLLIWGFERGHTETMFLAMATIVPGLSLVTLCLPTERLTRVPRGLTGLLLLFGVVGGATLWRFEVTNRSLDMQRLVDPSATNIPNQSMLKRASRWNVDRSYDDLAGRLDVIPTDERVFVTYDGFFNDNFTQFPAYDYEFYAGPQEVEFPSLDRRVVYGPVPTPSVFIIGPACDGILKTLRMITPVDRIDAVEIHPGVLKMMQEDYYEESAEAYKGLKPGLGNALSVLRRTEKRYDIITLLNAHSARWIGALGPPDFLHTRESYDLYLDHLTPEGYLLFEERPDTWRGELGVRRMIATLYDCLKRRGVEDPSEHFFVWEFMSGRYTSKGGKGIETGSDMYYVGVVVSLKPFRKQRRNKIIEWVENTWHVEWRPDHTPIFHYFERNLEPAYLKSLWANPRFGPFFTGLERGDWSAVDRGVDHRLVTNDRPFVSCSLKTLPELTHLVTRVTAICLILAVLFVWGAVGGQPDRRRILGLCVFNGAIGVGYFLVEILLVQVYQQVFLTPSSSLALVLGVLLLGSAMGGCAAGRLGLVPATALLVPLMVAGVWVPQAALNGGWSTWFTTGVGTIAVFAIGAVMGVYFPTGLQWARAIERSDRIPYVFAINALAGSAATVWSYYCGVRFGYRWTVVVAIAAYCLATISMMVLRRPGRRPD